jgi:hypothetical protein
VGSAPSSLCYISPSSTPSRFAGIRLFSRHPSLPHLTSLPSPSPPLCSIFRGCIYLSIPDDQRRPSYLYSYHPTMSNDNAPIVLVGGFLTRNTTSYWGDIQQFFEQEDNQRDIIIAPYVSPTFSAHPRWGGSIVEIYNVANLVYRPPESAHAALSTTEPAKYSIPSKEVEVSSSTSHHRCWFISRPFPLPMRARIHPCTPYNLVRLHCDRPQFTLLIITF